MRAPVMAEVAGDGGWAAAGIVGPAALALMTLIPLLEMAARPALGRGIENAPVLVQHLGLVMAMLGAVAAERQGHLTTLGTTLDRLGSVRLQAALHGVAKAAAALVCALLAAASAQFVQGEAGGSHALAYGLPLIAVQAVMPLGFGLLGLRFGMQAWPRGRAAASFGRKAAPLLLSALWLVAGVWAALAWGSKPLPLAPVLVALLALLLIGMPVFAVLGGLAMALFWSEGLPLASVPLSHYQITVNPSLPALPLYTLAGLVLARTGAASRLGALFVALFGGGVRGSVMATAVLCSAFTALTGGSGVTILALGGLLLPLLRRAGYDERRGIGLVTSASALGVLLAPSVPLIMVAVVARVPIADMFVAGLVPALVMVVSLLLLGGFLRQGARPAAAAEAPAGHTPPPRADTLGTALWAARWELAIPLVAVGSLASGLATPTESAALTAAYAVAVQALVHRELTGRQLWRCLADSASLIGGVMLILGMALALTNYLVDTGLPDRAVDWVQASVPSRHLFVLLLCGFLFVCAALMEIFAAIVVLVPLLLPLARSYGMDPVHFGIVFLAAMEVGFLCPPAGMNIYFASAMFNRSIREVGRSVLPALLAIFIGTLVVAYVPALSTGLLRR